MCDTMQIHQWQVVAMELPHKNREGFLSGALGLCHSLYGSWSESFLSLKPDIARQEKILCQGLEQHAWEGLQPNQGWVVGYDWQ